MSKSNTTAYLLIGTGAILFLYAGYKVVKKMFTTDDAENAIKYAASAYGTERAKIIEKMLRLETGNFTSGQYKQTGTAGMEAGNWGTTLKKYFPNGYTTITMTDAHTGQPRQFIKWNSVLDFVKFLNWYIDARNGEWWKWNALTNDSNSDYATNVAKVQTKFA